MSWLSAQGHWAYCSCGGFGAEISVSTRNGQNPAGRGVWDALGPQGACSILPRLHENVIHCISRISNTSLSWTRNKRPMRYYEPRHIRHGCPLPPQKIKTVPQYTDSMKDPLFALFGNTNGPLLVQTDPAGVEYHCR